MSALVRELVADARAFVLVLPFLIVVANFVSAQTKLRSPT